MLCLPTTRRDSGTPPRRKVNLSSVVLIQPKSFYFGLLLKYRCVSEKVLVKIREGISVLVRILVSSQWMVSETTSIRPFYVAK